MKIFNFVISKIMDTINFDEDFFYMEPEKIYERDKYVTMFSFHLDDLIERGIYQNIDTARKGFYKFSSLFQELQIETSKKRGFEFSSLIVDSRCKNSECSLLLYLNPSWRLLFKYYTIVPFYSYTLNPRTYMLLMAVLYYSRMKLEYSSFFIISIKNIISRLNLVDPAKTRHPKDYIKIPIIEAVKELNEAEKEFNNNFYLEIVEENVNTTVKNWIETSYIKVVFNDKPNNIYLEIADSIKKNKKIKEKRLFKNKS